MGEIEPKSGVLPTSEPDPNQEADTPGEWGRDQAFVPKLASLQISLARQLARFKPTARLNIQPGPIARRLNVLLEDECGELQAVFEERIAPDADEAVADGARQDTVEASRGSARTTFALNASQLAYLWSTDAGLVLALVLAALFLSQGPGWLEAILVAAALVFLALPADAKTSSRIVGLLGLGAFIVLILRPVAGVSIWNSVGSAVLAVGAVYVTVVLADGVIARFTEPSPSVVVLGVFVVLFWAVWNYLDTDSWPKWLRLGFEAWLIAGLGTAAVLALIQFAYPAYRTIHEAWKLARLPEAEFVHSALWAIGGIERLEPRPAATNGYESRYDVVYGVDVIWGRKETVEAVAYLATVLDLHISRALVREDPEGMALISVEWPSGRRLSEPTSAPSSSDTRVRESRCCAR